MDKKCHIDHDACAGCGRCIAICPKDAIRPGLDSSEKILNCKITEYAKAVLDGRPSYCINIVRDISPNCDCHCENDAPILPDIGMFASFDPLALDQACADACLAADPLPHSQLSDNQLKPGLVDRHDRIVTSTPESEWKSCLAHAEKIGHGTRSYELIRV